ncbi:phosphotransferase [Paraglaciecola sp.]|uniref:phosphotransferase n=1 Tax=Paraglaciecola sp. TaxID=1920173 RepID=UPI003EF6F165
MKPSSKLDQQDILNELSQSGLFSITCQLLKIEGGAVNLSYQLVNEQQVYFVKVFTSDEMVVIDRRKQFEQQKQLALLGLAPKPCFLSIAQSFQVDEWISDESLLKEDLPEAEKCRLLAQSLANIHQINNNSALHYSFLDLPEKWREYVLLANVQVSEIENKQIQDWADIWYQSEPQDLCVCHNDLSLQHVIANNSEVIFDWEYAAYSNRYFDIASCIQINQIQSENAGVLMTEYARLTATPIVVVKKKVAVMQPLVSFTNKVWFAAAKTQDS